MYVDVQIRTSGQWCLLVNPGVFYHQWLGPSVVRLPPTVKRLRQIAHSPTTFAPISLKPGSGMM